MKKLRELCFIYICVTHVSLHSMHDEHLLLSKTKKLSSFSSIYSLKQLCFNVLMNQEPQKAKELFEKTKVSVELLHEFANKMVKKSSFDYLIDLAEIFPTQLYPHIFLKYITCKTVSERQERLKKIGVRLVSLATKKVDGATTHLLEEMKTIVEGDSEFFNTTPSPARNIKNVLMYDALEKSSSLAFVSLLLKNTCSLDHWVEDCMMELTQNVPSEVKCLRSKFLKDENIFLLSKFAQENNLRDLFAHDIEKIALGLAYSTRIDQLLMGLHKFFHLGFKPYFERMNTMHNVINYIINRTIELDDDCLDCAYAQFKCEWDGPVYSDQNLKYKNKIWQSYAKRPLKKHIFSIETAIHDERYSRDIPLFILITNKKRNFYMSALKLLSFYYADEFAKNKGLISWLLQIPKEKVDAFIDEKSSYDIEKHIKAWQENN